MEQKLTYLCLHDDDLVSVFGFFRRMKPRPVACLITNTKCLMFFVYEGKSTVELRIKKKNGTEEKTVLDMCSWE